MSIDYNILVLKKGYIMNNNKLLWQSTLYSTAILMIAGSVIQAFLLQNGIDEWYVSIYMSVVQMVQVSVMFVVSLVIDRVKNVIKLCAYSIILQIVLFLSLIFLCVFSGVNIQAKYYIVFAAGVFANIIQAVYNIVSYKLPYHIVEMTNYAKLVGKIGVVTGVVGIIVSASMSFFTSLIDYNIAMLVFFVLGALSLATSYLITCCFKKIDGKQQYLKTASTKKLNLFKYRPFSVLIIPNLLRGFCTGILIVSMTIGHSLGITNKSSGAVLTLLLQVATVFSCIVYTLIATKKNDGKIIIVSTVLLAFSMPLMFVGDSLLIFYLLYFTSNFFINFINNAVPVSVTKFVDYEYIGQYSSWRMLLHTGGVAISNSFVIPLVNIFGGFGVMLIAALCQLVSGIAYYVFLKRCKYLI